MECSINELSLHIEKLKGEVRYEKEVYILCSFL